MALESIIETVRNRKTQKLFILVDDSLELRLKVINPAGEVLVLPEQLFDEDRLMISQERFATEFTPEQLSSLERFNTQVAAQARAAAPKLDAPTRSESTPKPRSTAPKRERRGPEQTRRGLGASWASPRLTFYRHKIEPLHAKQTFRITVDGLGDFEISKEEFLAQFNDVVMSPSYRAEGLYSYQAFPEKARRYIKT